MSQIDLSRYPAPDVLETILYEDILAEVKAHFIAQFPEDAQTAAAMNAPTQESIAALLEVEGNLLVKNLQAYAYHASTMRARVNDAAKDTMLAYATGSGLDNLAAFYKLERKTITPASRNQPAVMELDEEFRSRIVIAIDGFSVAGPSGAYRSDGINAHVDVKDVGIDSPSPGQVRVSVLSRTDDGTPSQEVLDAVTAALSPDSSRPLTDQVIVQAANVITYQIEADIWLYGNVDSEFVRSASAEAAQAYADDTNLVGYDVNISGIHAALHGPGVQRAEITSPPASIVVNETQAALCTGVVVTYRGVDV